MSFGRQIMLRQSTQFFRILATVTALMVLGWSTAAADSASGTILGAEVVTYPAPTGETLSTDYGVWADGKKVDVYTARVLDPPFADKQWDYGGAYSFANFDMSGGVALRITSPHSLRNTVV